ncbi:competence protein ComK [Heyndrickxia vini]|uniref:Competence protein ComK n=1 Tax=Heyndrickxia vini TaxID=1476025 RepID=A0ABX7DXI6_9BACI|nr:competence protein ComK [Heyndrickxia vini]QQZ07684.1 competence protein ComK [Heyndrickxia vini]
MKKLNKYVTNPDTCIIIPKYDEYGDLLSIVIEIERVFLVNMRPIEIINFSLLNHASSYRGATDGAKYLLGNTTMTPIMISEKQSIYCFPTMSPLNNNCVWLFLGQYKNHKYVNKKRVEVLFKNDHSIVLDVSQKSFEKKLQKAYRLKDRIDKQGQEEVDIDELSKVTICRDPESNSYIVMD